MSTVKYILVYALVSLLLACKTLIVEIDKPALIIEPTAQSRAELLGIITKALDTAIITLADDALVHDSQLIITRKQLLGRSYEKPQHFNLVLNGKRCELIHQESDKRLRLRHTNCIAK